VSTNDQDGPWQAAADFAKQFSLHAKRLRFAAFVTHILTGAVAASGLDVFIVRHAQNAGQDPQWWTLGINLALLLIWGAASVRYVMLDRRLRALHLSGKS
jgi:hypothetical protein